MRRIRTDHRHNSTLRPSLRKAQPTLEGLEDRLLLFATNGGVWTYGSRITYSFVPDGTNVGGVSSVLFRTLNAYYPTATWEQQFQKAAAIWEAVANINLVLVSDDGGSVGTSNYQQGNPNEGDIRIGAIPELPGQLGFAFLPPPINGGSDAGDIFINSTQNWGNGGADLLTVAIHEFGHALGMDHSQITTACMYAYYNGTKQSLTPDDISGIQSIYGPVPSDPISNESFSTATDLTSQINPQGQVALGGQSMASATDVDYYKVTVPATTTGSMVVTMQASNLSSLSPKVTIFDGSLRGLATAANPNSYGGNATVTISGVSPGQVYYIRASAAGGGPSNIGAFGLLVSFGSSVNFGSSYQAPIAPPNTVVYAQPDQGGGSSNFSISGGRRTSVPLIGNGQGQNRQAIETGQIQVGSLIGWGDALMVDTKPFLAPPSGPQAYIAPQDPDPGFVAGVNWGVGNIVVTLPAAFGAANTSTPAPSPATPNPFAALLASVGNATVSLPGGSNAAAGVIVGAVVPDETGILFAINQGPSGMFPRKARVLGRLRDN